MHDVVLAAGSAGIGVKEDGYSQVIVATQTCNHTLFLYYTFDSSPSQVLEEIHGDVFTDNMLVRGLADWAPNAGRLSSMRL